MHHTCCSICPSPILHPLEHSFGEHFKLSSCPQCHQLQLSYTGQAQSLPVFLTGKTRTMRAYCRDLSSKLEKRFHLKEGDIILDIGTNDATFLRTFDIPGLIRVGFEENSDFTDEAKTGIEYFVHRPWEARTYERVVGHKAKLITAVHMLEQESDPVRFLQDVEKCLTDDGIFLCELTTVSDILKNPEWAFIDSKAKQYFSFQSFQMVLDKVGFAIFDIEKILVGGEAYRFYCRKKKSYVENEKSGEELKYFFLEEKRLLTATGFEKAFQQLFDERQKLRSFLNECKKNKSKLWLYTLDKHSLGLLSLLGIKADDIAGIYDVEKKKKEVSELFPSIPYVGTEEFAKSQPDYLLVLPYPFINEFYQKEVDLREKGARFVLPLPEFRLIN